MEDNQDPMPQPLGRSLLGLWLCGTAARADWRGLSDAKSGALWKPTDLLPHQEGTDASPTRKMGDYTYGRELRI